MLSVTVRPGCGSDPEDRGHRIGHRRRVSDRRQLHEPHSAVEVGHQLGGDLHGQAGLADATHPDQGDQRVTSYQFGQVLHLGVTTHEARDLRRQVPGHAVDRAQGRKLDRQTVGADLEHPLDARQIPQAVLTQVPQIDPGHEPLGRAAHQHLATVADGHQPCRPVERRPEVVVGARFDLTRGDPHAYREPE